MTKIKTKIKKMLFKLPLKKRILFESAPDLSDNTKSVFDEMIKRGINKKYKFVWLIYDGKIKKFPKHKNVRYTKIKKYYNLKFRRLVFNSKILISCNRFMPSERNGQLSIYLTHGLPLKKVKNYYNCPESINYVLTSGDRANLICADQLNYSQSRCISLGYPRNDELYSKADLSKYFGKYDKYIAWYPTVRQFKTGRKAGADFSLPIIHDNSAAIKINDIAKRNNILIIVKPHFAQDLSYINKDNLSNVVFIGDDFFKINNISSYQFIGSTDALLTDYSSIYYDYLLCDKPIGLIWEDIKEYLENPGLIDNYEYYCSGGEKIYTVDDFLSFLDRIKRNLDVLKDERFKICNEVNYSNKPDNSERVVDFILDKMNNL